MTGVFIALLGFWTVLPVGTFLSFPKRIAVCLALSTAALNVHPFSFLWWQRDVGIILAESAMLFLLGVVAALPFLMVHQLIESAVESLEIIRGVNISSVLSPLTEHHDVSLVVLISCSVVSFIFIGGPFYFEVLQMLFQQAIDMQFHQLSSLWSLIESASRTFALYPGFFLMVAAAMLTSDIVLQILQKVFPVLVLQDFGFLFRTINALIVLVGILPNAAVLMNELLRSAIIK